MKETAVVILNYNGKIFLEKFLQNVIENSPEADVVIIDNASADDSIAFLNENFPSTNVIRLDTNYGFAEGYNKGLEQLDYPYFVLLNSDVEVTSNWLPPMLEMAKSNTNIAAIQPKILDYKNKSSFEYAGAAGGYLDRYGYAFCKGRIFDTVEKDEGQYDSPSQIFWASGACFFVKSDVFKNLGGFDGKFFAHMEEIDLCWRILNEDYQIQYQPLSKVYHVGGGTLPTGNSFKTYLNYRNNLAMLYKNLPKSKLFSTIFSRLCLDGISGIKLLTEGKISDIFAIIKAHFAFYGMIPYLNTQRSKKFEAYKQLHTKLIVWQYFGQKKKTFPEL